MNSQSLSNYVSRGSLVSFPYQCLCTPVPSAVVSTGACYFRPCSSVSFPAPTTYRPHFLLSTVVFQMPREPRPCSQERRAREAERQRVRRRSLADATDPVIVARRNNERDRRILHQRLRRERLRSTNSSELPPPFLPVHQLRAINQFMDRLLVVRDSLTECSTCLERYHGMHMRGVQCDRCHREVRPPCQPSSHSLTVRSPVLIGTATRMTQIPVGSRPTWSTFWTALLRWRRCCAVSRPPVFSCGSAKAANTRAAETSSLSHRT